MATIKITKNNFEDEVIKSDKPVLLDFWAQWCAPCKMISSIIDEVAQESENAKVGKVNVDEEPELAQSFKIMSIPALIVVNNGEVVNSSVGVKPKEAILKMLEV